MNDTPSEILQRERWSWWRRYFQRPPYDVRVSMASWNRLKQRTERVKKFWTPQWPSPVPDGIFGNSIRRVEFFGDFGKNSLNLVGVARDYALNRRRNSTGSVVRHVIECPYGALTRSVTLKDFEVDITEVDGISASKSAGRYFKNVNAFGQFFAEQVHATIDQDGLMKMLAHGEIRIVHKNGSDCFGVRDWDGRLFIYNSGGSHHFAAASYIARTIGQKVRIKAELELQQLNTSAFEWLLANFKMVPVLKQEASLVISEVAILLDACYQIDVPWDISDQTKLLLLPANQVATELVVEALEKAGLPTMNHWFRQLIDLQATNRQILSKRFGSQLELVASPEGAIKEQAYKQAVLNAPKRSTPARWST